MKKSLFYIATAALALVSCNEEELVNAPVSQAKGVLTATFNQDAATRTSIDGDSNNALTWSTDDAIAVFSESQEDAATVTQYTLFEGGGSASGTFEGDKISGNKLGAVFPYSTNAKLNGDELSIVLPNAITQTGSELDVPMWGEIEGDNISFKHLAGLLKVNLSEIPEGYNTLTVTADKPISGTFTATTSEENPVLVSSSDTDDDKTVTVTFDENTASTLYLPLPVASEENKYGSIIVRISGEDRPTKTLKSWSNIRVERAKVYKTSVSDYTGVSTEDELVAAVAAGGNITLVTDITLSTSCAISANTEIDLGSKTLTAPQGAFVVTNGTLTVKNGTIDSDVDGYDAIGIKGTEESTIIVNVESTATLKGGDCCVVVYGTNKSKNITINTAGILETDSEGYAAISANGNSEGVKMSVTDGSITAKVAAIYFPCKTSLTISGGTITGATAVYQKSGTLNISGGKLVGNGEKKDYTYNGNGCNETGDALVVESCNYPQGAPTISITGGEFVSTNASAIGSYIGNGATEKVTGFVQGGIFHDGSVLEHLAENANITLGSDITVSANTVIKNATVVGATLENDAKINVTTNIEGTTDGKGKGVFQLAGGTIKNVNFASPNTQYDIIVTAGGSVIEGCKFNTASAVTNADGTTTYGKRAIFTGGTVDLTGSLTVKSCTFDDKVYAFNFSNAKNNMAIAFEDCILGGWLSGHGASHTFTNCTFTKSGDYANYIPYCSATFNNCIFNEGFTISLRHGSTYTFDNCTYNETRVGSPDDLKWDFSGDGNDNGTEETVKIANYDHTWTNRVGASTGEEEATPEWIKSGNQGYIPV